MKNLIYNRVGVKMPSHPYLMCIERNAADMKEV